MIEWCNLLYMVYYQKITILNNNTNNDIFQFSIFSFLHTLLFINIFLMHFFEFDMYVLNLPKTKNNIIKYIRLFIVFSYEINEM